MFACKACEKVDDAFRIGTLVEFGKEYAVADCTFFSSLVALISKAVNYIFLKKNLCLTHTSLFTESVHSAFMSCSGNLPKTNFKGAPPSAESWCQAAMLL